jgi:outer membrane protein OmpA-like peptidoglycan-associated protein
MKKNFATYATGIAMPKNKQRLNYLSVIGLLLAVSIMFGCSATKNTIATSANVTRTSKNKTIFFENTNKSARLYGTVRDKAGTSLKDVQIIFQNQNVALTDEKGIFSFNTEKEAGKMYQLIFSIDGYNKAVRNYNTEMNDANYNIVMVQPCKCDTTICNTCFTKNIGFDFEKESATLTKEQKLELDALIECLKLHPEKEIRIQHNTMFPKRPIGTERLDVVLKYFTQKGIMDYRIKKETTSKKNTDVKQIEITSK